MNFDEVVRRAVGPSAPAFAPYAYQRRIAEEGLPDLLEVPTGCGKTLAAVLPWLYRRKFHADQEVKDATPHWLVVALPMRVLVEQTLASVRSWVDNLGLADEVGVHTVMGGERRRDSGWRLDPARDAIFVGTIDMLLSRALNRGYGESRFAWPIDFGLLSSGSQWVFDEVQLMGPALPTSRQLEGLRAALGTAAPTTSMWMSATVDHDALATIDNPAVDRVVGLSDADRTGPLARRLDAAKTVRQLDLPTDARKAITALADELVQHHQLGTRTLAMVNTVERARDLAARLDRVADDVPVVLVHSRFRPAERAQVVARATADVDPDGPGVIVVSTQVLEAGVDISSAVLFTEAASWPAFVQRTGRCNRAGELHGPGRVLWARPPRPAPYAPEDVEATVDQLIELEGQQVTPAVLTGLPVKTLPEIHPVLRRRDLLELFDTTPDLSGNDIDVARFIRSTDDTDVAVAWWPLPQGQPPEERRPLPGRDERCPVPLGELRTLRPSLDERRAWRMDHLTGRWTNCRRSDLRPGMVVVLDQAEGCYDPVRGWNPASKAPVPPVSPAPDVTDQSDDADELTDEDVAVAHDPLTRRRRWLSLSQHLADVEAEARALLGSIPMPGLADHHRRAAIEAGRLHDIGKAHEVFQASLRRCAADDDEWQVAVAEGLPLAKSGGSGPLRHDRRYFRHELASALALLDEGASAIDPSLSDADRFLVVYLVAAHHGRVRMGLRSMPGEQVTAPDGPTGDEPPPGPVALGVIHGERLPAVEVHDRPVPESTLDLTSMAIGSGPRGRPSWSAMAMGLRDRPDLGPFRLATLEAIVRMADWRASKAADERGEP